MTDTHSRPIFACFYLASSFFFAVACGQGQTGAPSPPASGVAGTGVSAGPPADAGADARPSAYANACDAVAGAHFVSRESFPKGDAPDGGTAFGKWELRFRPDAVICWEHDDVACDTGTYTCENFGLKAAFPVVSGPSLVVLGSYDSSTGTVTWDDELYDRD
jgi:hypothetical protein